MSVRFSSHTSLRKQLRSDGSVFLSVRVSSQISLCKQLRSDGSTFLSVRPSSHISLHKQLRSDGSVFLFVRVSSQRSLHKQPHSGWSVGRAGLANEMSLPCLRHAKRKQGRRSWSLQSLSVRDSNRPKPAQSSLFRRCRETNPDGVEGGDVPLRQGRLISFANPVLPTDQPCPSNRPTPMGLFTNSTTPLLSSLLLTTSLLFSLLLSSYSFLLPSLLLTTSLLTPPPLRF